MKTLFTLLLALGIVNAFGQTFTYPQIKQTGKTINDFVPAGWTILDKARGDMNNDKLPDVALILQHRDSVTLVEEEEDTVITQPRILALLFKNPNNGGYYLVQQSNTFILPHDRPTMDEPYQSIAIKKGVLDISFQLFANMGGWDITNGEYKFRYQNNQFVLIGAENYTMNRATGKADGYSYNFLTQKRSHTKDDNKKDGVPRWKKINIALNTLTNFKVPFTWQVEEDVYL